MSSVMYEGGSKTLKPYIYNYCFNYYNSKTFQIFYNMFLICEDVLRASGTTLRPFSFKSRPHCSTLSCFDLQSIHQQNNSRCRLGNWRNWRRLNTHRWIRCWGDSEKTLRVTKKGHFLRLKLEAKGQRTSHPCVQWTGRHLCWCPYPETTGS